MAEELGTLIAKLGADITELKTGLAAGRRELSGFKDMATKAGEQIKSALAFAGIAVGIAALANAVKGFAVSVGMTGARTETLQIAMEQIGK